MAKKYEGHAVGIDLGTSYSCVAIWQGNRAEIIHNEQGNRTTPSFVAFTDTQRLVGDAAKNQAASNPSNTIFDAKRLIGRKYTDAVIQNDLELWPFKVIAGTDDKPFVVVNYKGEEKHLAAEEISSMILSKMREIAEAFLGSTHSLRLHFHILSRSLCWILRLKERFLRFLFAILSAQINSSSNPP
ncbi:hypothetical protein RJT34_18633 [Clitoria ternatea]|uniref:Heat shock protein 70 n=1 Tax=Clitoria ternatea TaxID=43366 RepID=A0AAN9JCH6_CLITE